MGHGTDTKACAHCGSESVLDSQTQALLASLSSKQLLLSRDLRVLFANDAFRDHLGRHSESLCGRAVGDLFSTEEFSGVARAALCCGAGQQDVVVSFQELGSDRCRSANATLTPLFTCDESVASRLLVTLADDPNATRDSLEARYRDLVERLDAFVWEVDPTTLCCTYVSQRAEDILGYSRDWWLDDPEVWANHIHPDDREEVLAHTAECLAISRDYSCDYRAVTADGRTVWLRGVVHLVRDVTGNVALMRGFTSDITEQKNGEARIRRLNRIYSVTSEVNQLIARERDLTKVFPAACRIAVEQGRFRMAWMGMVDLDTQAVNVMCHAGEVGDYLRNINIALDDGVRARGPVGTCLELGRPVLVNDIEHDPCMAQWRADALRHGFRASAAFPLLVNGVARGVIGLYAAEANCFDAEEIKLFEELAQDLAFALEFADQDTQRRETEVRLQHNETMLSRAQSLAEVGCWSVNQDNEVVAWSDEALRLLGVSAGTPLTFMTFVEAVHPDDRGFVEDAWARALAGAPYRIEHRVGDRNSTRWVEARADLSFDSQGHFLSAHGVIQDITERKQAAEAHGRLLSIVDSTPDFVAVANLDNELMYLNDGGRSMLGVKLDETLESIDILALYPDWARVIVVEQGVPAAVSDGVWRGEVAFRHRDGSEVPVSQTILAHRGSDGSVDYLSSIARDLTLAHDLQQQKMLVQEVQAAHAEAEAANRSKSEFLAVMSHEIRTPMNGIIGMLDVLTQSSLHAHQSEMVELARESSHTLLTIIEDVLDFSKIEAGKITIEHVPVGVEDVVEKVCLLFDGMAEKKNVELTLFVDPDIPQQLQGDSLRLRQVLINLINNAVKFSSGRELPGRVTVRAELASADDDTVWVNFIVADNGIGISASVQNRLFKPFQQADSTTTRRFGGTGLGLVIARQLADLMGGDIALASEPEVGSTFTLRLPFAGSRACSPEPSVVDGLACLVIGPLEGLTADLGRYLARAGARVQRVANIDAASVMPAALGDLWVWVFDAEHATPPLAELRAAAKRRPGEQVRMLVVSRGKRRAARFDADDLVHIDGNLLTRRRMLEAVAIAAGRSSNGEQQQRKGLAGVAFAPPTRDTAIHQGQLILIAEDNEINQQVILRQLALLGLAADVVVDGRKALERWQSGDYSLLLTDIHMPEMDGYMLTAAIRAEEAQSGARPAVIIALTANAIAGESGHCRALGMNDYLSKPIRLADLKVMLEQWLVPLETVPEPPEQVSAEPVSAPVEVEELKALVGDDAAVINQFFETFRQSAKGIAEELRTAGDNGDLAGARGAAHKLSSAARSVGALKLSALCDRIERAGKTNDAAMVATLLPRFFNEIRAVDDYLAHWPDSNSGNNKRSEGRAA
ncbi:MAG: PAS domain S-box-containing protein [Gammaproteobacteria bacterium]|jgi:PAS domain S-box-containing protein